MISTYRDSNDLFTRSLDLIERSGVVEEIEDLAGAHRGVGGRPARGIRYTVKAILVTLGVLIDRQAPPTVRNVLSEIVFVFNDVQLASLGMSISQEQRAAVKPARAWNSEYKRFLNWVNRRLVVLDSHFDLPARRVLNAEYRRRLEARTDEEVEQARLAADHARRLCNKIVAASVCDPLPEEYDGDIVVDETIFDVAKTSEDVGGRPTARRSAVPAAGFYVRSDGVVQVQSADGTLKTKRKSKSAFGIGVTAIIRVGRPTALRKVVPLVTGIDINQPTPGSVDGLRHALDEHTRNGFDPRTVRGSARNGRWPYIAIDMGYNPLDGFAGLLVERRYSMLATYPKTWGLVSPAEDPQSRRERGVPAPGPIVGHGDIYCPAAVSLLRGQLVTRQREMSAEQIKQHDRRLRDLLPLLMGTNSRIKVAALTPGRPRKHEVRELAYKVDVICPAVQHRVRCRLKPGSMGESPSDVPEVEPDWEANEFRCCAQSHTTISLTPEQFKRYQGSLTPGSWEHSFLFEAYRSMTERQFSIVKSPYVTAVDSLNLGPRREPLLKFVIALTVAISNLRMQDAPRLHEIDSVTERLQRLERHLGRPPAKTPART